MLSVARSAELSNSEPSSVNFAAVLDKHAIGTKQLEGHINLYKSYVTKTSNGEKSKSKKNKEPTFRQLLYAQSMATLNWLAKQLSLVLVTKKKETIIGEFERVAGVSTVDEIRVCAGDKIVLKAPDFRDCHTIHTEGLAIDVDTYFSLKGSLRISKKMMIMMTKIFESKSAQL